MAFPSEEEARVAGANEATVILSNRVREAGIAGGVCTIVAARPQERARKAPQPGSRPGSASLCSCPDSW